MRKAVTIRRKSRMWLDDTAACGKVAFTPDGLGRVERESIIQKAFEVKLTGGAVQIYERKSVQLVEDIKWSPEERKILSRYGLVKQEEMIHG